MYIDISDKVTGAPIFSSKLLERDRNRNNRRAGVLIAGTKGLNRYKVTNCVRSGGNRCERVLSRFRSGRRYRLVIASNTSTGDNSKAPRNSTTFRVR